MKQFGVIGSPISHSLSPIIHNFLFSHFGIRAHYSKIHVPYPHLLSQVLDTLQGANITLPYKEEAFGMCHEVFGIAQEIGAVNTIVNKNQKRYGFNTDAFGFWECVKDLDIQNALILGAGGSSRAIALILQKRGIEVSLYNRTLEKMKFFKDKNMNLLTTLNQEKFDLVIHATSVGLDGKSIPYGELHLWPIVQKAKYVFDVIYPSSKGVIDIVSLKEFLFNRPKTAFTAFAQKGIDGLDMLLYQALFAFEIFCNQQYCFDEMKALFYNS